MVYEYDNNSEPCFFFTYSIQSASHYHKINTGGVSGLTT